MVASAFVLQVFIIDKQEMVYNKISKSLKLIYQLLRSDLMPSLRFSLPVTNACNNLVSSMGGGGGGHW